MEYKWNNPPIAKTSFEIYKCLAKERHFSIETMKNFINNNVRELIILNCCCYS